MTAKDNAFEVGQSRIGLMIDGLKETPRVAVKLERHEDGIELTVPFLDGPDDPYSYWFSSGIMFGDDPNRTKRRYEPPASLSYYDAAGKVGLVGSRMSGARRVMGGMGIGEGRLRFDYTVLGAMSGPAYERINGLRSEIEGLGTWVGLRSLRAERTVEDGRVKAVDFKLESPPNIRVGRRMNAEFRANWRYGQGVAPDETTISERLQIQTEVKRPVDWDSHLKIHFSIRNLLRVVAWRPLKFASHEAMSAVDGIRTMDGKKHGDVWLDVLTRRTDLLVGAPTKLRLNDFLFGFSDVGVRGVGRWLRLVERFERGLSPLIGLLDLEGASIEAYIAQVGIGFEMLGHDLLEEAGASKTQIAKKSYADLVTVVADSVSAVLPFPGKDFSERLRRTYVGTKHANRVRPDLDDALVAYLQAIQVVRAWVGVRLGVQEERLRQALANDSRSRRITELLD